MTNRDTGAGIVCPPLLFRGCRVGKPDPLVLSWRDTGLPGRSNSLLGDPAKHGPGKLVSRKVEWIALQHVFAFFAGRDVVERFEGVSIVAAQHEGHGSNLHH